MTETVIVIHFISHANVFKRKLSSGKLISSLFHLYFSADNMRPYISGWQGGSNYINAVYVDVSIGGLT